MILHLASCPISGGQYSDALPNGGIVRVDLYDFLLVGEVTPPLTEMQPGKWLHLAVSDNGTGIPAKTLPHIFEPFFTTKSQGRGTGLGLAQVYGIIRHHDGFISVKSEVGVGTTFDIYLPAIDYLEQESQEAGRRG